MRNTGIHYKNSHTLLPSLFLTQLYILQLQLLMLLQIPAGI